MGESKTSAQATKQNDSTHGFRQIEADIKGSKIDDINCVLLFGDENYLIDIYEKKLLDLYVNPAAAMLDFMKYDGEEVTVDDIIAACDTLPMMSSKRVVLVSGFPGDSKTLSSSKANSFAEYIADIPGSALLIISLKQYPDRENPNVERSNLYKEVKNSGKAYKFDTLERTDVKNFIRGRFAAAGKEVSGQAIDEILKLSEYFGRENRGSLYSMVSDINRIAAYAEGNEATISDVSACMGTSIETDVFALLDAVSAGNKGTALEIAVNITSKNDGGTKSDRTFQLISLLTGQFEIMLGYRELNESGLSIPEITKKLNQKSEYRVKKAAGYANKYSIERLMELLHRLYRVDGDIKSGLYGERLALTMFIAEM